MSLITVTESAAEFIVKNNIENAPYFRVSVVGGGCSGFSIQMNYDISKNEKDFEIEQDGIKILVDPKSLLYLAGAKIESSTNPLQGGLIVENSSFKSKCGCGSSFST